MSYIIRIYAMGKYPEIPITKKQFLDFSEASSALSHGLSIEEKYEILFTNYLEFEKEILSSSADFAVRIPFEHEEFFEIQLEMNRKLVNLLTSARLYIDQILQNVQGIMGKASTIGIDLKKTISQEYDKNFEYQFMEALRNHVQHKGLPVHKTRFGCSTIESDKEKNFKFSIEIESERLYLSQDKKFPQKVLKKLPAKIDLKLQARGYIESLSKIHAEARRLVGSKLEDARVKVENAISSYKSVYKEEFLGLYALHCQNKKFIEKVPLVLSGDNTRLRLTRRNRELVKFRNCYVSNEVNQK